MKEKHKNLCLLKNEKSYKKHAPQPGIQEHQAFSTSLLGFVFTITAVPPKSQLVGTGFF